MKRTDLLVVGGGLAGLAAAALAARAGVRVHLLEAAGELGGRARTRVFDGFSVNLGAHAFFRGGAACRVFDDLGVRVPGRRPPAAGIAIYGGRLHAAPGGPVSLMTTSLLDTPGKLELSRFMSWLGRAPVDSLAGHALGEVLGERVPTPAVRALVSALVRCTTYDADVDELCAAAALEQVQSAMKHGVIYVDGGWATLVTGLAGVARAHGARLELGARIVSVERDDTAAPRFRARLGDRTLEVSAVIVATPPGAAAGLFPSLARVAAACTPLRTACLDVALSSVPKPRCRFALGLDSPLYYSLHSASARLADEGAGVAHLLRYGPATATTEAELEALLARMQPGARVVDMQYLPSMTAANARVTVAAGGLCGRPPVDAEPGVWLAGDWVGQEGMLADAACASAAVAARRAVAFLQARARRVA